MRHFVFPHKIFMWLKQLLNCVKGLEQLTHLFNSVFSYKIITLNPICISFWEIFFLITIIVLTFKFNYICQFLPAFCTIILVRCWTIDICNVAIRTYVIGWVESFIVILVLERTLGVELKWALVACDDGSLVLAPVAPCFFDSFNNADEVVRLELQEWVT